MADPVVPSQQTSLAVEVFMSSESSQSHNSDDGLFPFDVFLSHSSKDKAVVRALAERLRGDGVKVWFDEWEIRPGDSIFSKVEEGLEQSRILVLCMSANAFGSDWAVLESQTFRFRDPLNRERRFVPLLSERVSTQSTRHHFFV